MNPSLFTSMLPQKLLLFLRTLLLLVCFSHKYILSNSPFTLLYIFILHNKNFFFLIHSLQISYIQNSFYNRDSRSICENTFPINILIKKKHRSFSLLCFFFRPLIIKVSIYSEQGEFRLFCIVIFLLAIQNK